ncbi:MAG: hypothetical protein Q8P20_07935 [bacterium]|nr:hypothetical protein [bacterium]
MKMNKWFWIVGGMILTVVVSLIVIVVSENKTVIWLFVSLMVLTLISMIIFFIIKNANKPKTLHEEQGKRINFNQAKDLARETLGESYYEYPSNNVADITINIGQSPDISKIYIFLTKGAWDSTKYYVFGVNMYHSEDNQVILHSNRPFTFKEIGSIANNLATHPEKLEVIEQKLQQNEFGELKPVTTITRQSRTQMERKKEEENQQSEEMIDDDSAVQSK